MFGTPMKCPADQTFPFTRFLGCPRSSDLLFMGVPDLLSSIKELKMSRSVAQSLTVLAPRLIETRRKLCGEGVPLHEALNFAPAHHYGIPAWFGDPGNPPAFESQRVYLKRHGLLLPAERRQIPEPVRYPLRIEAATRWK